MVLGFKQTPGSRTYSSNHSPTLSFKLLFLLILFPRPRIYYTSFISINICWMFPEQCLEMELQWRSRKIRSLLSQSLSLMADTAKKPSTCWKIRYDIDFNYGSYYTALWNSYLLVVITIVNLLYHENKYRRHVSHLGSQKNQVTSKVACR